jgi:hypothetical protein
MGQHGNIKQNGSTLQKLVVAIVNVEHHCNGSPTYKDKWGSLYGEYKNIHDYMNIIGNNKKILGDVYKRQDCTKLVQTFSQNIF